MCLMLSHISAGHNSSVAVAEAKQKTMKRYKALKKNPRPKLYDKPPHLLKENE